MKPRLSRLLPPMCAVGLVVGSGCATVPITGRRQLNLVSDQEVLSASSSSYRSFMQGAKVSTDVGSSDQVARVGRRIADATESYLRQNGLAKEVANFSWEFNLVRDDQINAFCMPGGKIVVYTGLMALVSSDDDLAVVLGHEVAHAVAKHSNERMSQEMVANAGSGILSAAMSAGKASEGATSVAQSVFGLGANLGVMLPYSRKHESEADYMGLVLMTMAGYNPDAAVSFWTKMASSGGKAPPELLSSHPSDSTRIAQIRAALPDVKRRYSPASAARPAASAR